MQTRQRAGQPCYISAMAETNVPAAATGAAGFVRGLAAAMRGMPRALGSGEVRAAYGRLVLILMLATVALAGGMIYSLWHFTGNAEGWLAGIGGTALRIAGTAIALFAAPVLALFTVNIVFPLFAESVFFAGMRVVAPAQASALQAQPGLPIVTSVWLAVVLLLYFVGLSLMAFALAFVPVVGPVLGPLAQIWITAKTLGWELLDPYFDKREMRFGSQRDYVNARSKAIVGFAMPFVFVLAIPFVGPLFFGMAQAGAAMLLVEVLESQGPQVPQGGQGYGQGAHGPR